MANLDLFNAFWKRTEQEAAWRGYASSIRKARPFSLDDEMADVVGQLMLSPPADLRKFLISSRLPFPVMWLEADFAHGLGRVQRREDESPYWITKKPPERIGWLLTETPQGTIAVTRVARVEDPVSGESGEAMVYPATLLYSTEHKLPMDSHAFRSLEDTVHPDILDAIRAWNRTPLAQASPWGWDGKVTGSMDDATFAAYRNAIADSPLHETCVTLLEPNMIARLLNPRPDETEPLKERAHSLLMGAYNDQYGDLAFIVSAIAMMNEVPVKYVPFRPSGHMRAGGTLRPYMQSSIVSIEVPASRRRLKDIRDHLKHPGEGRIRARHEVRGHWRHVQKLPLSAGDTHRWERWTDRSGRPCWRTWIEHHERGSGQIGFVQQTYQVVRNTGPIPGIQGDLNVGV